VAYGAAMGARGGGAAVHFVEHGAGTPVVVLHGAGVDHREPEACFEPVLAGVDGWRRVYPDLPGMGRTPASDRLRSAADVLAVLTEFVDDVTGGGRYLLVGHSAGAYFARAAADRAPERVAGLALVCPLLAGTRDVPEHRVVETVGEIGDGEFRSYFVVHTPAMLDRYQRYVVPGAALADHAALERIAERWELEDGGGPGFAGPTLLVAGRQDSTVGYAATVDLADDYPGSTLAVVDGAGHALPHERPHLLGALVRDWLARVATPTVPTSRG
jgi:pimeloyl-ACP methyl ester carboxylesterase